MSDNDFTHSTCYLIPEKHASVPRFFCSQLTLAKVCAYVDPRCEASHGWLLASSAVVSYFYPLDLEHTLAPRGEHKDRNALIRHLPEPRT